MDDRVENASAGREETASPPKPDVCCGCKSGIECPNCPESNDGTSPRIGSAEWYADRLDEARSALAAERAAGEAWRRYAMHQRACANCEGWDQLRQLRCATGKAFADEAINAARALAADRETEKHA